MIHILSVGMDLLCQFALPSVYVDPSLLPLILYNDLFSQESFNSSM